MTTDTLYEQDFMLWTERQAEELRRAAREGSNLPLDWENLAEEIESLGRRDRRSLHNRIYQILRHLLKMKLSTSEEPRRGWRSEVSEQRRKLAQVLRDSPSLRPLVEKTIAEEWSAAVEKAEDDLRDHGGNTSLRHLHAQAPLFTAEEVMTKGWYPEPEAQSRS